MITAVDPAAYGEVNGDVLVDGGTPDWRALAGSNAIVSELFANDEHIGVGDTIAISPLCQAPRGACGW